MKKSLKIFITIFIFSALIVTPLSVSAAVVDTDSVSADVDYTAPDDDLPDSYSSLDLGYCTEVKTQSGNTCWSYASIASLESLLLKEKSVFQLDSPNLSESMIDIWGTIRSDGTGWQRDEGDSGYTYIPIGFLTSRNTIVTEDGENTSLGVNSIAFLNKGDMTKTKELIMQSGAVTANFNSYSGAYSKDKCSYCLTDEISYTNGHTVSVVGWDDNYSASNFDGNYAVSSNGAWLCKNSWGSSFNSLGGYMWISYEDYYLFNDNYFAPCFGVNEYQLITDDENLYQNEEYGATYEFNYVDEQDITYFNVFDFSESGNILDKVIFETRSQGANYTVYYTPVDENGIPMSDESRWTELSSGTTDYRGYICCDIEDVTLSSGKGAIAVNIDTTVVNANLTPEDENYVANGVGVCEWLRHRESETMIFVHQGNYNESFIKYSDGIVDVMDVYLNLNNDTSGGTLVIKALTNGTADTSILGDVDLNGKVDINDATLLQKYLCSMSLNLMDDQLTNADFNGDCTLDINDVTAIQKYLAQG